MSRPAEELLEFDRLKDIVSRSTTCAPGRRAIEALVPQQDVASLDAEFELVREAIAYLRAGSELGFGSLADPDAWLARLGMPALGAGARGTSRRRFARGKRGCSPPDIQDRGREVSASGGTRRSACRFPAALDCDSPRGTAQRRNQRRRFAATETHSRRHDRRRATQFGSRSKRSCARAANRPARITSRCATTAS